MADRFNPIQRSRNMAAIKNKHTIPEINVRQALEARGMRCSTHNTNLPGKPDLVLNAYKTVIFVHGCFWHMHNCKLGALPTSNIATWHSKLSGNKERDTANLQKLHEAGWRVRLIWLCELKNKRTFFSEAQLDELVAWIQQVISDEKTPEF